MSEVELVPLMPGHLPPWHEDGFWDSVRSPRPPKGGCSVWQQIPWGRVDRGGGRVPFGKASGLTHHKPRNVFMEAV